MIRTAGHEAELHDGLEQAAKRAKDRTQVALWQAQAADIKDKAAAMASFVFGRAAAME